MFPYNRLYQIFYQIKQSNYIGVDKLIGQLHITDRTLRSDIQIINEVLQSHGAIIKLKRKIGYFIEVTNNNQYSLFLENLYQNKRNTELDSSQDRIKYLLQLLLYANDYILLDDLADEIYVSKNTLLNYMKTIKQIFNQYNLEYISKGSLGVKAIGNEEDKRKCIIENIFCHDFQSYITGFSKNECAIFYSIDLDLLKDIISNKLDKEHIRTTDFDLKNLIIHFALMISRIENDCYINSNPDIIIDEKYTNFINELFNDIEKHFNIIVSNGEKKYLYSHLVANTPLQELSGNDEKTKLLIKELLQNIFLNYNFDLQNDDILKHDLFQHFKSILNTKSFSLNKRNPLLNTIKTNFPLAYDITLTTTAKILCTPPYVLTDDEVGYVSLHIGAAIERCFSGNLQSKSVILVCGSGQATIRMLEARLNIFFKDKITIVRKTSYHEFINYTKRELLNIDFVISTIPLDTSIIPTITVDFALNNQDIEAVSKFLTSISLNKMKKSNKFFSHNLFFYYDEIESKEILLKDMYNKMLSLEIVDTDYLHSVMERENLAKTNMNDIFALPHPMKLCAKETKVAIAIINKPLLWYDKDTVQIVLLLAIKQGEQQDIEHLYDIFIEIVNNIKLQQQIIHTDNFDTFISVLEENIE